MKAKPGDRAAAFRIAAPLALILVLLSALLIALRIEQVMLEFAQGRSLRTAQQISDQVAAGYRLGLGLQDQTQLPQGSQRPGQIVIQYQNGVLNQSGSPVRTIRFPYYAHSSHPVSLTEPQEFFSDVSAWLKEE